MERKQRRLDGDTDTEQSHSHRERFGVGLIFHDLNDRLMHRLHQKMPGDPVEDRQGDQHKTGTEKGHDHILRGRQQVSAPPADHDQPASRDGVDLDEHVAGEHVVGVDQRQQRAQQQVHHDIVQILFLLRDIHLGKAVSADQREKHDKAEKCGCQRLQDADPDLVSERRGERSHAVVVRTARIQHVNKRRGR